MKAITVVKKGETSTGKRIVDAFILADTDPATLPKTGANVDGLTENDIFAPFSLLFVIAGSKVYIADESGEFASV